jgi:hypothetical protein
MEPRSRKICRRAALLALGCALLPGCVGLESFVGKTGNPPTGTPCQIVATWNKEVYFAPDPTHGGQPTPGLSGRLYLFGPRIDYPFAGDGSLMVDLYVVEPTTVENAPAGAGQLKLLEQWRIDKVTLKKLLRKDTIGWGYTLFLPWGTYKPEITQVYLRARYDPPEGMPLYTESNPLTLAKGR